MRRLRAGYVARANKLTMPLGGDRRFKARASHTALRGPNCNAVVLRGSPQLHSGFQRPTTARNGVKPGGGAIRSKTIVYFEWIIFGTLLLRVLQNYLSWDRVIALSGPVDLSLHVTAYLIFLSFMFVLQGTLTLLVSRRRSKIAMWVSIAMFTFGLPVFVQTIIRGLVGSNIIAATQGIGQFAAFGLLFTLSARRWMNREDTKPTPMRGGAASIGA
jgi:hypothetical protein